MLARRLAQMTGLPIKNILKTAYRPHQSRLNRISRLANKTNAFTIKNTISPLPKNIILLDDVISSGSTANACAEVLSRSGAQKIIGWFIASNH
jgi:predicted amidophosphoribosyltransferase